MNGRFFLDTNVIAYSFDGSSPDKQVRAKELIQEALLSERGVISYQVFQEFVNFALKAKEHSMTLGQVQRYTAKVLKPLCRVHSSSQLFSRALGVKERTKFSWYDSLVVAGALEAECEILYSEDLQHRRKIEGLTVVNPFG